MFLNPNCPLSFVNCAIKRFLPNEIHKTRVKEDSVLLLMLEGNLYFSEDETDITLTPGEYYIQQAGLYQKGKVPSPGAVYFYLTFDGEFSETNGLPVRGNFSLPKYRPLIDRIIEYSIYPATLFDTSSLMYQMFSQLYADSCHSQPISRIALDVSGYLIAHYKEHISLKELSERFSYSEDYIIREFKNVYNRTPHAYLNEIRINAAKQLLLSSEADINQIALECGFTEPSNFYRNFKYFTSMTPREWRRSM